MSDDACRTGSVRGDGRCPGRLLGAGDTAPSFTEPVADQTYTSGGDNPTTFTIAAGLKAGTVTITVTDDSVDDDDETILIDASSANPALTARRSLSSPSPTTMRYRTPHTPAVRQTRRLGED